jgi:hypothetical protein
MATSLNVAFRFGFFFARFLRRVAFLGARRVSDFAVRRNELFDADGGLRPRRCDSDDHADEQRKK